MFGPEGAAAVTNGSGLVGYDLGKAGLALAPNATLAFLVDWQAPLAPGGSVERRVVYRTEALRVRAEAPLLSAWPAAGLGDAVRVSLATEPVLEGWQGLLLLAAALLAGAWVWDRRRRV